MENQALSDERQVKNMISGVFRLSRPWLLKTLVACLSTLIVLSGCCGPSRPTTIPVSGTITFAGGPPPAEGAIYFAPVSTAAGYDKRPGRARFDTSGKFSATSFADGDGLVPGTYKVTIECWKTPPLMGSPGNNHVPANFTPPNLVVPTASGKLTHDIDVPSVAPAP